MAAAGDRRPILLVVVLAALLRLPTAFVEMYHHPDEVWQYLEPAYGMVTGHAIVTWEYRAGLRSWLIPSVLAGPLWLGKALWPAGLHYLVPVRVAMVGLSLLIVGFGAAIGERISRLHGLVVGLVLATSFELVYFSGRTLSDTIAPALFVPAAWALLPHAGRSMRRLFVGGVLLGLVVATRLQLAPAAAVLAIGCCRADRRVWAVVIAGGMAGLTIDALVDALHGMVPFHWMIANVRLNLIEHRSADYGVAPPQWYPVYQLRVWGWAALPMLALAGIGARRLPSIAGVALATIAVHSLIPHKEYRFVLLAVVLLILLAAIGSADVIAWARARWPQRRWPIALAACAFWLGCSVATALSPGGSAEWSSGRKTIALSRAAHDAGGACGLAYYQPSANVLAAYTYYDRATPIYLFDGPDAAIAIRRHAGAFDKVVTSPDRAWQLGPGYRLDTCLPENKGPARLRQLPERCLFVRQGTCGAPAPARWLMNAALARRGE